MSKVCKLCDCGFLNVFEESDVAPRKCEKCKRNILQKEIFSLEDYEKQKEELNNNEPSNTPDTEDDLTDKPTGLFKLVNLDKNIEIVLPENEDVIIGREALGAEFFGTTISRKHLYVTPRGRLGISVVDKDSLNGTKVNDEVLQKGVTKIVVHGNTITLDINESGITFELQRIE